MKNKLFFLIIITLLYSCSNDKYLGLYINENYNLIKIVKENNKYFIIEDLFDKNDKYSPVIEIEIEKKEKRRSLYFNYNYRKLRFDNNVSNEFIEESSNSRYFKITDIKNTNLLKKYKKFNIISERLNRFYFITNSNKVYQFINIYPEIKLVTYQLKNDTIISKDEENIIYDVKSAQLLNNGKIINIDNQTIENQKLIILGNNEKKKNLTIGDNIIIEKYICRNIKIINGKKVTDKLSFFNSSYLCISDLGDFIYKDNITNIFHFPIFAGGMAYDEVMQYKEPINITYYPEKNEMINPETITIIKSKQESELSGETYNPENDSRDLIFNAINDYNIELNYYKVIF